MNDFENLEKLSECGMASYCKYSSERKYCLADEDIVINCPYLRESALNTMLNMENEELLEYKAMYENLCR